MPAVKAATAKSGPKRCKDKKTMTTATGKTNKTAKPTSAAFEAFSFPTTPFEIPSVFRDFAEKSVTQAREAYAKLQGATEEASGLVEETLENAREGALAIGAKALDAAKSNTDASFAFAQGVFGAKTMSEVIELQSAFARKQFDAIAAQAKEFQALGEKYLAATTKPTAAKFEKAAKEMNVA
jgi:phasin